MAERGRPVVYVLCYSVILGYVILAASDRYGSFSMLPLNAAWLYVASFLVGAAFALSFRGLKTVFLGVGAICLLAVSLFAAVVIMTASWTGTIPVDLIAPYAFQQALPRLLYLAFLGTAGAFLATVVRVFRGGA